jgi:hypothetical protein
VLPMTGLTGTALNRMASISASSICPHRTSVLRRVPKVTPRADTSGYSTLDETLRGTLDHHYRAAT